MDTALWKDEARKAVDRLQSVRDEIRVQLHLAGMDAKDRWHGLEPRIQDVTDRLLREGSEGAKKAFQEIVDEVKTFRASLVRH